MVAGPAEATAPRAWLAALGLVAVVFGVLVMRSPGAQAGFGWFSYGGAPPEDFLDSLVAWNQTRVVGAALVLGGLLVMARLLGLTARRRTRAGSPVAGRVLVLAAALLVGGLVAFVLLGTLGRSEGVVAISKAVGPRRHVVLASTVWTREQAGAALVAAAGLVAGAVGSGLHRKSAPSNSGT